MRCSESQTKNRSSDKVHKRPQDYNSYKLCLQAIKKASNWHNFSCKKVSIIFNNSFTLGDSGSYQNEQLFAGTRSFSRGLRNASKAIFETLAHICSFYFNNIFELIVFYLNIYSRWYGDKKAYNLDPYCSLKRTLEFWLSISFALVLLVTRTHTSNTNACNTIL